MDGKQANLIGPDQERLARALRQRLLHATDWIETCRLPVDKVAWLDYRQKIIEAPSQPGWPHKVDWPKPPR